MKRVFTFTESPIKDMWEHLKFLGIENNSKRILSGQIKSGRTIRYDRSPDLNKKSKQISMCIKQAYEYFMAAESVSINTSPVLYFYGMLSLSKALIVANKPEIYLEDIKYHGLETRPRHDFLKCYLENPTGWTIEKEFAVTNDGVFKYLTAIIDDFIFPASSVINFKDILSISPEISEMYFKFYGTPPNVIYMYRLDEIKEEDYKIRIGFKEKNLENIYRIFPQLDVDFNIDVEIDSESITEFVSDRLSEFPEYLRVIKPSAGGRYFTSGINYFDGQEYNSKVLSEPCIDYLALFILSICVRYKQDFWGEIVTGRSSGVLSIIEMYINGAKRRFPNMILNQLFNEEFVYGSSGYLS